MYPRYLKDRLGKRDLQYKKGWCPGCFYRHLVFYCSFICGGFNGYHQTNATTSLGGATQIMDTCFSARITMVGYVIGGFEDGYWGIVNQQGRHWAWIKGFYAMICFSWGDWVLCKTVCGLQKTCVLWFSTWTTSSKWYLLPIPTCWTKSCPVQSSRYSMLCVCCF